MRRPLNWIVFSMSLLLLAANLALSDRAAAWQSKRIAEPALAAPPAVAAMRSDPELSRLVTYGDAVPAVYVWPSSDLGFADLYKVAGNFDIAALSVTPLDAAALLLAPQNGEPRRSF